MNFKVADRVVDDYNNIHHRQKIPMVSTILKVSKNLLWCCVQSVDSETTEYFEETVTMNYLRSNCTLISRKMI